MRNRFYEIEAECECQDGHFTIHIEEDPGNYSGPPENCWPSEIVDTNVTPCNSCGRSPNEDKIDELMASRTWEPVRNDPDY